MVEKQDVGRNKKSPVLAAIISAIFPGAGFFYVGNVFKGVAYMIIFALLVVLEVHSSEYGSRVMEIIVFGFLIAGFYIFQVIESFNDARAVSIKSNDDAKLKSREEMSLSGSIAVLIMGIIFLLINFDVLTLRQVIKLWPLVLVGFGLKFILNYFNLKKKEEENE